jgi:acyl-CoA synthetase (NDP forming)
MTTSTTRADINQFLALPRLAIVGASRDEKELGGGLFRDMLRWGYQVVPVNPHVDTIAGAPCYARVQDITPAVDGALLLTAPRLNAAIVEDCAQAGVKQVWFYGVGERSQENERAIEYCRQHDIAVIPGFCPYMFMPSSPFPHKLHGFVARLSGGYPR